MTWKDVTGPETKNKGQFSQYTTQKGVAIKKIFELRAETRTERSLGCQMTIAKKKFGRSDKPAAWRGPKPLKIAIFEAIRKKRKIEKIASKLVGITRRKN